jgi:hypothetical protein
MMRDYLKICMNIIGVALLLYFTPLMLAVLDLRVLKTNLLRDGPSWIRTALFTLYQPFLEE